MLKEVQRIYVYITICIPLCTLKSEAQTSISASYPEIKHTYFLNTTHAIGRLEETEKTSVNIIYQNYMNLLREIRLADFSGYYKIGKLHQVGMLASSFQEGEYISKTSLAAHYAINIKVMRKSILSSAVTGGFKSIMLDGSLTNLGNRTSFAPDISLNVALRNPHYFLFVASNQLIGNKVSPGFQALKLKRFYESRIGLNLPLSRRLEFISHIHILMYEKMRFSTGACVGLEAYSIIKLAFGTYDLQSLLFQTAISIPDVKSWKLSFQGSYRQLMGVPGSLVNNSMEISLLASKKNKKNVYDPEE